MAGGAGYLLAQEWVVLMLSLALAAVRKFMVTELQWLTLHTYMHTYIHTYIHAYIHAYTPRARGHATSRSPCIDGIVLSVTKNNISS